MPETVDTYLQALPDDRRELVRTVHERVRHAVPELDNAVFAERPLKQFLGYVRYHLSDHRPLWAQFSI